MSTPARKVICHCFYAILQCLGGCVALNDVLLYLCSTLYQLAPQTTACMPHSATSNRYVPLLCCLQRLMRDFKRLQNDPPQGIDGSPNPDNIMLWNAIIFGPEDTPWDGGNSSVLAAASRPCTLVCYQAWQCTCAGCSCTQEPSRLTLEFSEEYPNKAPVVKFVSNIFHPNGVRPPQRHLSCLRTQSLHVGEIASLPHPCAVYADGGICLDILQNQWSPIYDVAAILTSIQVHAGINLTASWRSRHSHRTHLRCA